VKNSDFESLRRGLAQAKAHIAGEEVKGLVIHKPVDVRQLRERLDKTRKEFAATYGLDPRTVEQWEQGRRHPDRSTETYLRLIEQHADELARFVSDLDAVKSEPIPEQRALVPYA